MKKFSEKIFINVVSNIVLFFVIVGVIYVSFGNSIISAFNPPSDSAIYRGNTDSKKVSLMINVYWGTEYIDGMLAILKENNVKATFFIGGSWANKNSEVLLKIKEEGHELGNHGFFHKDHKKLSYSKNQEEILYCEKVVETLTGVKTKLFAPPSGAFNNTTLKAASDLGYKTIMWSKDTIDWRDQDETVLFTRATKDAKGGDLVLMHPTKGTLNILNKVIKKYNELGLSVVTVSENLI